MSFLDDAKDKAEELLGIGAVPDRLKVSYEVVDSSCIVPMNTWVKREYAAYTIRPKIRKVLAQHLEACPEHEVSQVWRGPSPYRQQQDA